MCVTAGLRATDRSLCVTETRDPLVVRSPVWRSRPALVAGTPAQARTAAVVGVQAEHVLQELGGEFAVGLPGEMPGGTAGGRIQVACSKGFAQGAGHRAAGRNFLLVLHRQKRGGGLETDL